MDISKKVIIISSAVTVALAGGAFLFKRKYDKDSEMLDSILEELETAIKASDNFPEITDDTTDI